MNKSEQITEAFMTGMRDAFIECKQLATEHQNGPRDAFFAELDKRIEEFTDAMNILHRVSGD